MTTMAKINTIQRITGKETTVLVQTHDEFPGLKRTVKIGKGWIKVPSFEQMWHDRWGPRAVGKVE